MKKRIRNLRKEGTTTVEMLVPHKLPFATKAMLHQGRAYDVDNVTAEYLVSGYYATYKEPMFA